jgi:hypothetical protein
MTYDECDETMMPPNCTKCSGLSENEDEVWQCLFQGKRNTEDCYGSDFCCMLYVAQCDDVEEDDCDCDDDCDSELWDELSYDDAEECETPNGSGHFCVFYDSITGCSDCKYRSICDSEKDKDIPTLYDAKDIERDYCDETVLLARLPIPVSIWWTHVGVTVRNVKSVIKSLLKRLVEQFKYFSLK